MRIRYKGKGVLAVGDAQVVDLIESGVATYTPVSLMEGKDTVINDMTFVTHSLESGVLSRLLKKGLIEIDPVDPPVETDNNVANDGETKEDSNKIKSEEFGRIESKLDSLINVTSQLVEVLKTTTTKKTKRTK